MTDIAASNVPTEPTIWTTRTLAAAAMLVALVVAGDVWAAAQVDEDFNVELWGEVEEIMTRRA